MQFHAVNARFLATDGGVDKLSDEFFDFAVAQTAHMSARNLAGLTLGRTCRCGNEVPVDESLSDGGRDFVNQFRKRFAHFGDGVAHGHHVHHEPHVLSAGVMKLHEEFCSVAVNSVGELLHRRDIIVVRHAELRKCAGAVVVVDTGDFGDNQSRAAFCALLIIIHELFRGTAVGTSEPHHHGRHDYSVFDFASAYFHR